jgi:hypothetical protein
MDWVLRFKKKLIIQWQGTDVLLAHERTQNKTIYRKYIDYATNLVDAPWLKDELENISIKAKIATFKYVYPGKAISKYDQISIMSYVAQKEQEFYGIDSILKLAIEFPKVDFNLYGMQSSVHLIPNNVHLKGWVNKEEMAKAMKENAVFLRLTEHDGYSVSVIEAQGFGSEVIWTFPGKKTSYCKNLSDLKSVFIEAIEKIEARGMIPNQDAIAFASHEYNKQSVLTNYLKTIKDCVG